MFLWLLNKQNKITLRCILNSTQRDNENNQNYFTFLMKDRSIAACLDTSKDLFFYPFDWGGLSMTSQNIDKDLNQYFLAFI